MTAAGADDRPDLIDAVGKVSEAFEYVERARGHLYSFHQLMGRADLLFGEGAELLELAGAEADARAIADEVVGRNVLDGRWTFQIVDEYDAGYYDAARVALRHLEAKLQGGERHVYEARLKEERRSHGRPGHERRPPVRSHPGRDDDNDD